MLAFSPRPSYCFAVVSATQTLLTRERAQPSDRLFHCSALAVHSGGAGKGELRSTDIRHPDYFHKVVDCQWACPAHTPVPEYIRLIAAGRYTDAYMVNWASNVFPGILGRTCDRPCEPACRRGRVEEAQATKPEPVAICRLKRVAADFKDDDRRTLAAPRDDERQAHRLRRRRAGVADRRARSRAAGLPRHRVRRRHQGRRHDPLADPALPLARGGDRRGDRLRAAARRRVPRRHAHRVDAARCWQRIGTRCSSAPARRAGAISRFRAGRRRQRTSTSASTGCRRCRSATSRTIGKRVIVLGGGNTAMDCCRTAKRLGGEDVKVIVRSPFEEMKASPWEKEDAMHEGIPILDCRVPQAFLHTDGKLTGMSFEQGARACATPTAAASWCSTGEPDEVFECDEVLVAVGQENAFPWIERRRRHRVRRAGHAGARRGDAAVVAAARVLRRRRGARPEEHHLGRRAGPRGGDLDRQVPARRGRRASAPRRA